MFRRTVFGLSMLLATALPVRGEILYAAASGWQLFWFDSEDPGTPLGYVSLYGDLEDAIALRIEFDPVSHRLYGFGVPNCNITCPPSPVLPLDIDRLTGQMTFLDWPDFPSHLLSPQDMRIDPNGRDLRFFGGQLSNLRYSLRDLELNVDQPLSLNGSYHAVAFTPPGGEHGGETLALYYPPVASAGPELVRIGGVGGNPPASSGQVTQLGDIEGPFFVNNFDISVSGNAYLLGYSEPFTDARLYRLDLTTLAMEDLGEISPPFAGSYVQALAAPPAELGVSVMEVPALSNVGAGLFALLGAWVAMRRLRGSLLTDRNRGGV